MLVIQNLDGATVERAGALVAREQAAARRVRPELPTAFDSAEVCAAPRVCPDGQPYIGATAVLPAARGQGVGHALVDAALTWAYNHGYQCVSVDFDTANRLSRPFWLNVGFHPAGYDVLRVIDGGAGPPPNAPGSAGGR